VVRFRLVDWLQFGMLALGLDASPRRDGVWRGGRIIEGGVATLDATADG
jgi:hypothetical protein